MKPNIETLPCFDQVAKVIGREKAKTELLKSVGWRKWFDINQFGGDCDVKQSALNDSFSWEDTPQGWNFWCYIDCGVNPYTGEKVE